MKMRAHCRRTYVGSRDPWLVKGKVELEMGTGIRYRGFCDSKVMDLASGP